MSRYSSSSYSSRYGDKDYSSSSYLSGSGRKSYTSTPSTRTSSYTPRTYDSTTSPYSSYTSKYGDYSSSKYSSKKEMEDITPAAAAPIVEDEVKELDYEVVDVPTEDVPAPTEVLQESQIEEFAEEKPEEEEVNEEEIEEEPASEEVEEEEEQVEEEPEPTPEPVVLNVPEPKPLDNRTSSPTVLNAKKLGGIPWPPKDEDNGNVEIKKNNNGENENAPKKRVSDLIARFNQGKVDNEAKKTDSTYKSEYGAGTNVGKVALHNFA